MEVILSNRITVIAVRTGDSLEGALRLEVHKQSGTRQTLLGAWDWFPKGNPGREAGQRMMMHVNPEILKSLVDEANLKSPREKNKAIQLMFYDYIKRETNPLENEDAFLNALRENIPSIFFLSGDRILSADEIGIDARSEIDPEMRRNMRPELMLAKGRERALDGAIFMASEKLLLLAVRAARQGTTSMHTIYQDLIKRLASHATNQRKTQFPLSELTQKLMELSSIYDLYAKYGLTPKLQADVLVELLGKIRVPKQSVAEAVLEPYVESLTEQANSLKYAYKVIDTFVSTANDYLWDKKLEFSVGEGMLVRNQLGEVLQPRDLSSGEQQIILLFCHIIMAHESGGIFIVDEPEISLNVKWQRRLVESLLRLDLAGNLQFVLASHSMEVLTQHSDSVVPLIEVNNA